MNNDYISDVFTTLERIKAFFKSKPERLLFIAVLCVILFGGMYFLWRMYKTHKYSTHNWNTYLSQDGKYSFKYPDTKMHFSEYGGLELYAYRLPPHEKVPFNIQIQYTPQSTEQTNAATLLKKGALRVSYGSHPAT
jgi:hypothetical protein